MDNLFYADLHQSCSYSELIKKLNSTEKVVSNLYQYNEFDFFVNFLGGLLSSVDMVLLDNDFSAEEVEKVSGSPYKEIVCSISALELVDLDDLLVRVRKSSSKVCLFTSGTTGVPKTIEHSVESITRNIKSDNRFKESVWGFAFNPTHMAGIQVFFQAILNGNALVNIFGSSKQDIFKLIELYGISHISATPTFYRLLVPSEKAFPTVKQITFGGEKSDKLLHQKVSEVFPDAKIRNVYASTEAGALFASRDDGFVIPIGLTDKIKIEDGELIIHKSLLGNSSVFSHENPWYATGDMVEILNEQKQIFRIISRKSEIINVGGYKVNPNEVEMVLRSMKGIQESRVYGIPNSVLGNILCVDVVKSDQAVTESDIKNFLVSSLQSFKVPRRVFFKDTIALSRTGKIDRKNDE
jgi:acyl-coenzyme A synthetase/AMP-(fatty) acid ligase